MMDSVPLSGTLPRDFAVPTPSPLRALLYALLTVCLLAAAYVCFQTAVMIYDFYQILQWLEGLAE